jgi:hypothetical protein
MIFDKLWCENFVYKRILEFLHTYNPNLADTDLQNFFDTHPVIKAKLDGVIGKVHDGMQAKILMVTEGIVDLIPVPEIGLVNDIMNGVFMFKKWKEHLNEIMEISHEIRSTLGIPIAVPVAPNANPAVFAAAAAPAAPVYEPVAVAPVAVAPVAVAPVAVASVYEPVAVAPVAVAPVSIPDAITAVRTAAAPIVAAARDAALKHAAPIVAAARERAAPYLAAATAAAKAATAAHSAVVAAKAAAAKVGPVGGMRLYKKRVTRKRTYQKRVSRKKKLYKKRVSKSKKKLYKKRVSRSIKTV